MEITTLGRMGDPLRLTDSDVLRFQWPSVGQGWEDGLLNFARSRILSSSHPDAALDDAQLFISLST